jgi:hypothetical protein
METTRDAVVERLLAGPLPLRDVKTMAAMNTLRALVRQGHVEFRGLAYRLTDSSESLFLSKL